jgi:HSP20 family protein
MTSTLGIGQLKHAKKDTLGTKVKISKPRQSAAEAPKKQEGQLAVDIMQTDTEMVIICPIAGVEKSDIKVAIQDDVLTIRGERRKVEELSEKTHIVKELFWGTFSRSIVLPDHIDRKNISARVHEHLLIVTIPKTEDFKTRIIHINEEE